MDDSTFTCRNKSAMQFSFRNTRHTHADPELTFSSFELIFELCVFSLELGVPSLELGVPSLVRFNTRSMLSPQSPAVASKIRVFTCKSVSGGMRRQAALRVTSLIAANPSLMPSLIAAIIVSTALSISCVSLVPSRGPTSSSPFDGGGFSCCCSEEDEWAER